jgi:hypothetical protein
MHIETDLIDAVIAGINRVLHRLANEQRRWVQFRLAKKLRDARPGEATSR